MIKKAIIAKYGTRQKFCEANGHSAKDLARTLRTLKAKLNWADAFLAPLDLKTKIAPNEDDKI